MASDMPTILPRTAGPTSGYSAAVRIELKLGDRVLIPTHSASDFLIFREPQTLSPAPARLIISVDGVARESAVEILAHISPAKRVPIRITG